MRHLKTLLAVLGASTILVLAANSVALATAGKGFILGKSNKAATLTSLTRTTPGPALAIRTKSGSNAPLAVNGTGRVANLNADKLDGLDSTQLATTKKVDDLRADVDETTTGLSADLAALRVRSPFANGFIAAAGTFSTATSTAVTGVVWDASLGRYVITLAGTDYYYSSYDTAVTPVCEGATASTGSYEGNLLVKFTNPAGAHVQCAFTFSTTKLT